MIATLVVLVVLLAAACLLLVRLVERRQTRITHLDLALTHEIGEHLFWSAAAKATRKANAKITDERDVLRRTRDAERTRHAEQLRVRDRAFEFTLRKIGEHEDREHRIRAFMSGSDDGFFIEGINLEQDEIVARINREAWRRMWNGTPAEPVSVAPATVVSDRTERTNS